MVKVDLERVIVKKGHNFITACEKAYVDTSTAKVNKQKNSKKPGRAIVAVDFLNGWRTNTNKV